MTTWVLLRGLMREARHWGDFPRQFQAALGADRMVTLDFPGNGSLHELDSASDVPAMVQHCRTQLVLHGYAPPYHVFALSLGAMVAIDWATAHPREIARLVLVNTSLAPYSPFYQRLRPANYPALLHALLQGNIAQREALILRLTSTLPRTPQQRDVLLREWEEYASECPVRRANVLRQLRAAMRYRAAATVPPLPLLLLASQHDALVDVQCSLTLACRWRCAIALHPEAGHDLPLDAAPWVVQQVQTWLASASPAPAAR